MMKLQVRLFGRLGANLGSNVEFEFLEEPTIRIVIHALIQKDPSLEPLLLKNKKLSQGTVLLLNGQIVDRSRSGLDLRLSANDRVTVDRLGFLEIVGGG